MTDLRILIAPSGFKECLDAEEVAAAIALGVRRAAPSARVIELPLPDGEGFARTLTRRRDGDVRVAQVRGPLGENIHAQWGFCDGAEPVAVIDMASAAGLSLVPLNRRNPLVTCTYGVGELIRAALDAGARRIIVGCGDSGTNDGGAGALRALGARFLDVRGCEIAYGGGGLLDLHAIDASGLDPRLASTRIEVACNMRNVLCGPLGVAAVYGPQKGASPADVLTLERAMARWAVALRAAFGRDVSAAPGCGASGGLGAALHAALGARLMPRMDVVAACLDVDAHLAQADLIITAEGALDAQSVEGKIPSEIGRRAARLGVPVVALAGVLGQGADTLRAAGVSAMFAIAQGPCTRAAAMAEARDNLATSAENVMRAMLLGLDVAARTRCCAA